MPRPFRAWIRIPPQTTRALAQIYYNINFTPSIFDCFAISKINDSKNLNSTSKLQANKFGLKPGIDREHPQPRHKCRGYWYDYQWNTFIFWPFSILNFQFSIYKYFRLPTFAFQFFYLHLHNQSNDYENIALLLPPLIILYEKI